MGVAMFFVGQQSAAQEREVLSYTVTSDGFDLEIDLTLLKVPLRPTSVNENVATFKVGDDQVEVVEEWRDIVAELESQLGTVRAWNRVLRDVEEDLPKEWIGHPPYICVRALSTGTKASEDVKVQVALAGDYVWASGVSISDPLLFRPSACYQQLRPGLVVVEVGHLIPDSEWASLFVVVYFGRNTGTSLAAYDGGGLSHFTIDFDSYEIHLALVEVCQQYGVLEFEETASDELEVRAVEPFVLRYYSDQLRVVLPVRLSNLAGGVLVGEPGDIARINQWSSSGKVARNLPERYFDPQPFELPMRWLGIKDFDTRGTNA